MVERIMSFGAEWLHHDWNCAG
ncbi:unnamed protein product [Rhodiola kirilowii]